MAHLLEALQAGALTLHNRLVMPPMAAAKSEAEGGISQAVLDYYQEKSDGGYFSALTEAIKKVVSIPVILTGGVIEPQAAEQLLVAEKADFIGVGRAVLKDSQWAKQAIETLRNAN